jgi:hypothetical protein
VPLIYPGDVSGDIWRNFPPSISQFRAFRSSEAASDFLTALGYNNKIDTVEEIDLDNIRKWAANPEFKKVNLRELEQFEGVLNTYFLEVEKHLPDDIDMDVISSLMNEIFNEPKLACLKYPDTFLVTEEELQIKINNVILKQYYQNLIRHFERVVCLSE